MKELVEREGIFAFVGGVGAACGMAVKDYLTQNKIIWVGPSTAINDYVFPVNPYLFAVYPLYEDEASILTKYVVEKLGPKRLLSSIRMTPMGRAGYRCKARMNALKMKLVEELSVEPGEKDLSSQMLRLKNSARRSSYHVG